MRERNLVLGALPGALAGLVASYAMNQFQKVWAAAEKKISGENQQQGSTDGEDATMKTADRISSTFTGHHLTKAEKKKAGPLVHYAFGTFMGAVYRVAVEVNPLIARARWHALRRYSFCRRR
jgi:putative membrane protein